MPRESTSLKDILQIFTFLAVTGLLIGFYVAYPLNRTAAFFGRADLESFNPDSLPPNDPTLFAQSGIATDSFSIDTDGLTTIAALFLTPKTDTEVTPIGTIILIHDERNDRGSMLPLAQRLLENGYSLVVYDQRASGFSGGKYHGDGFFEATDLAEIIPWLDIRQRISHPLIAVGFSLGADAALIAARSEVRIDGVIAIEPYLSTDRRLTLLKKEHGSIGIPFFKTIIWWWYDLRSGYESRYTDVDDIEPVASPTLILVSQASQKSKEFLRLKELSSPELLFYKDRPETENKLNNLVTEILAFSRELAATNSADSLLPTPK